MARQSTVKMPKAPRLAEASIEPPPPPTPPAPKDPMKEATEMMELLSNTYELEGELDDVEKEFQFMQAKRVWAAGKVQRLMGGHCRTADAISELFAETFEDHLARHLLATTAASWQELQKHGGTDQQICDHLNAKWRERYSWPDYVQGGSTSRYREQARIADLGIKFPNSVEATVTGSAVIALVRRLMKVPKPAKPPEPAKKPDAPKASKSPAKKKSATKSPAAKPPAAAKAKGPPSPAYRAQTFGQWMATVRGSLGTAKAKLVDEKDPRWQQAFAAKERPSDAGRRISAAIIADADTKDPAAPIARKDTLARKATAPPAPLNVVDYIGRMPLASHRGYAQELWNYRTAKGGKPPLIQDPDLDNDIPEHFRKAIRANLQSSAEAAGLTWHADFPNSDAASPFPPGKFSASADVDAKVLAADTAGSPPEPADQLEERIVPPITLEAAQIQGETIQSLRTAYSGETIKSGRVKRIISSDDDHLTDYVITGMALRENMPDVFSLAAVVPLDNWEEDAQPESYEDRKAKTPRGKPLDLEGVFVVADNGGGTWVFTGAEKGINVSIPKGAAAGSKRKAGAA